MIACSIKRACLVSSPSPTCPEVAEARIARNELDQKWGERRRIPPLLA